MPQATKDVFIDSFDARVKEAYQGRKSLRNTVRVKTGVIGSTHRFTTSGQGVATQHNRGNAVIAMNAGRGKRTAILEDWNAFDYSDVFDLNKINFDDKKIIASTCVKAIGRREDQIIIDVAEDSLSDSTPAETVGDGTTAFSVDLIALAAEKLDYNNVDSEDRCIVYSSVQKRQLLNTTEATSADYNSVRTLVKGDIDTFYGFKFVMIGNRQEGGLPRPQGVEQYAFAYHKEAIGLAIGLDMRTMVDWIALYLSWQIGCIYSAGATNIDNEGIVAIKTDDSPTP